jgi:hypothetical protein
MDQPPAQKPVHQVVSETFASLGLSKADREAVVETILIRDGQYAGHSFRAGRLRAIWFLDSECVEIRDVEGRIVTTASTRADEARAA